MLGAAESDDRGAAQLTPLASIVVDARNLHAVPRLRGIRLLPPGFPWLSKKFPFAHDVGPPFTSQEMKLVRMERGSGDHPAVRWRSLGIGRATVPRAPVGENLRRRLKSAGPDR